MGTFTVTVKCVNSDGRILFTGTKDYTSPIYYHDCGATGVINSTVGLTGGNSVMGNDFEDNCIVLLHPCVSYLFKDFSLDGLVYGFPESIIDEFNSHLIDVRNIKMQQHSDDIDLIKKDLEYLKYISGLEDLMDLKSFDPKLSVSSATYDGAQIHVYNTATCQQLESIKSRWTSTSYTTKLISLLDYKSPLNILYQ